MRRAPQVSLFQLTPNSPLNRLSSRNDDVDIKPVVKEPAPIRSPKRGKAPGILHPFLFENKCVLVNIYDAQQRANVEQAMRALKAITFSELQPVVDIIITDGIAPQPTMRQTNTRGSKMAAAAISNKESIIVNVSQIPWALKCHAVPEPEELKSKEALPNAIVVADSRCGYRPLYKQMTKIPELYFNVVPRGYFFTPFTQPPDNAEAIVQKYASYNGIPNKIPDGPREDGFCELCGVSYHGALAHRETAEHVRRANSEQIWSTFDDFANNLSLD